MNRNLIYDIVARDKTGKAFRSLGDNVDHAERRFGKLKSVFAGIGGIAGKIAPLAAVVGAAGLGKSIMSTVKAADEMSKAAQKIGVPIEELSRLKYAADLSGVSFGGLQTAVGKLSRNMDEAATGNKEYAEAFERLGIRVTDANGKLRPSSRIMAEMADRFRDMPDGAEKTALAMQLMGRSGADMIPMLNGGTEAMNKLMGEAGSFGQVFSESMGKDAEAFNDNLTRLGGAFAKISGDLAGKLLPHLVSFTDWLVENTPAISRVGGQMIDFAATIIKAGSELTVFVTEKIAQFTAALHSLPDQMRQVGADIIAGLWSGLSSAWDGVSGRITGLASNLKDKFTSFFDIQSPSRVMMDVGRDIMAGLAIGMDSMTASITGSADEIGRTVGNAFSRVIDGSMKVKDALRQVGSQLLSMATNSIFRSIFEGGSGRGGGGFFSSLLGGLFGGFREAGGPVSPGKSYVVGEGGPEVFRPSSAGTIIPNGAGGGGGGGVNVEQHFHISGALSSEDIKAAIRQEAARTKAQIEDGFATMYERNNRAGAF
ncbi:phage tail tape measure protein [Hoeflea sp.]|uniref:phage tail tape measure protein n=1 Tax=Hoeflea sp. TaxID=1940281 RepID=UPI003B515AC3